MRAKTKIRRRLRNEKARDITKFGDMITADHSYVTAFRMDPGLGGQIDAFVVRDLKTKIVDG